MKTEKISLKEINDYIRSLEQEALDKFGLHFKEIDDLFYRLKQGEASKKEIQFFIKWKKKYAISNVHGNQNGK